MEKIEPTYSFVPYGKELLPEKNTLVLDVGMKTMPGVIDHHHPHAEPECTASLITKYPELVLHHLKREEIFPKDPPQIRIITHRLPDFDSISSIFLSLKLLEQGNVDVSMEKIAHYAKIVDSASLPREIDLASTPYSILRALFRKIHKEEELTNLERVNEGLKLMRFLHARLKEGYEILENRPLFRSVERYQKAMEAVEEDYFDYLEDLKRARMISLHLPLIEGQKSRRVEGLIIKNPRSFLLKEWARRDRVNSTQRQGFSFLMTNFGDRRYILGVYPETGVYLYGLGELLNIEEEKRRIACSRPLAYRWYDGNCPFFNFRIIDSPQDGTSLSQEEIETILFNFSQEIERKFSRRA